MTPSEAKKIGRRQGLIAAALGMLIAELIMVSMFTADQGLVGSLQWYSQSEYGLNILVGLVVLALCGAFYGQLAGRLILVRRWNAPGTGILISLAVLVTTAFLAGWMGYFGEGIHQPGSLSDPFVDYILKPAYWIILFGTVPALLVGIWFGVTIRRRGRKR
jgi:hypothetical protein